jgi:hypothetical protein
MLCFAATVIGKLELLREGEAYNLKEAMLFIGH